MFLLIPHSIVNLDQCDMQSVDLAWDNSAANYRLAFDADETDDDVSEIYIPDRVFLIRYYRR